MTLGLAASLTACAPADAPADVPTLEQLADATYRGVYDDPVRLTDGQYEGEPFQPDAASRPTLTLLGEPIAFGDLDGDASDEAVLLLAESSGGSGVFVYLAVVGIEEGEPLNLATRLLGDRVDVSSLAVENGRVLLELTERQVAAPVDPVPLQFILSGDELLEPGHNDSGSSIALRGLLVWGHEIRSFRQCDSPVEDWFADTTGGDVRTAYEALAHEPYEPLLFEVIGTYGLAPEIGFGIESERTLTITDVISATRGSCDD